MNQGTKWVLLMKTNKSKKSRASVPIRPRGRYLMNKPEFNNLMRLSFYMKIRHTDFMLKIFCIIGAADFRTSIVQASHTAFSVYSVSCNRFQFT
jgi:hypothetical protein